MDGRLAYRVRLGGFAGARHLDAGSLDLEDLDIAPPSVDLREPLAERSHRYYAPHVLWMQPKVRGSMQQSTYARPLDLPALRAMAMKSWLVGVRRCIDGYVHDA